MMITNSSGERFNATATIKLKTASAVVTSESTASVKMGFTKIANNRPTTTEFTKTQRDFQYINCWPIDKAISKTIAPGRKIAAVATIAARSVDSGIKTGPK